MSDHERTPDGAEEALARLRAADPARTARPDMTALRAVVDARRGVEVTDGPGGLVVVDDLSARRRARAVAWPRAVGFAASLLLVGGGGYAVGLGAGGGQDGTPDVVATTEGDASVDVPEGVVETFEAPAQADGAPEAALAAGGAEMGDAIGGYGGPLGFWEHAVFHAGPGLSTEGGTAPVYGLAPPEPVTEETMARFAAAFGVVGAVEGDEGFWNVGGFDGRSPSVSLYDSGDVGLNFYDPGADPWSCPGLDTPDGACVVRDLGAPPDLAEAQAEAEAVIARLGLDPAEFSFAVQDGYDEAFITLAATLVVDGRDLHHRASFTFSGAGLQSAYLSIAALVPLGDYTLISPAEAAARFSDPRFAVSWAGPVEVLPGGELSALQAQADLPPAVTVTPGMPVPWPVSEVTLSGAELVLSTRYLHDGTILVVPTYRLTSAAGGVWEMIALADTHLDFSDGT